MLQAIQLLTLLSLAPGSGFSSAGQEVQPVAGKVLNLAKADKTQARFLASDLLDGIMPRSSEALDLTAPQFKERPLLLSHELVAKGRNHCYLLRIPAHSKVQADLDNPHMKMKVFNADQKRRTTDPGSRNLLQHSFRSFYRNDRAEPVEVIFMVQARNLAGVEPYNLSVRFTK